MHCSYWAQILFQRDWFFLISVCSRSIIVCQFPIMLWINKAAATIRRILYGWRILCCFFPCFLILASGQFLNITNKVKSARHSLSLLFTWQCRMHVIWAFESLDTSTACNSFSFYFFLFRRNDEIEIGSLPISSCK